MHQVIPYFYADLVARVAPGAFTLWIFSFTGVLEQIGLRDWVRSEHLLTSTVGLVTLAGTAYLIGLIYETLLNPIANDLLYKPAFGWALSHYWGKSTSREIAPKSVRRDVREWANLCTRMFHHIATSRNSAEIDHVTRMLSEAKMFFFLVVPSLIYLVCAPFVATDTSITNSLRWQTIRTVNCVLVCLGCSYLRYERRALQMLRYIEFEEDDRCASFRNAVYDYWSQYESRRWNRIYGFWQCVVWLAILGFEVVCVTWCCK